MGRKIEYQTINTSGSPLQPLADRTRIRRNKAMKQKQKYANDYSDSFIPTFTWEQAKADQIEREEKQAEKVEGDIEFRVMSGWHRFSTLSVEAYYYKYFPEWVKWLCYILAFLAFIRLGYYMWY